MENTLIGSKIYLIGMLKVFNKASDRVEIFKTIMAKNFPDLLKDTPNSGHVKENEFTSGDTLVKFWDVKKNKSLRHQEKMQKTPRRMAITLSAAVSWRQLTPERDGAVHLLRH